MDDVKRAILVALMNVAVGTVFEKSGAVVWWLSLLHNFIHLSLNPGSAEVQILRAASRRFAMVRITDYGLSWKEDKTPFVDQTYHKKIHHHHMYVVKGLIT